MVIGLPSPLCQAGMELMSFYFSSNLAPVGNEEKHGRDLIEAEIMSVQNLVMA